MSSHNLLWISGVVGFVLPHLIALLNQSHWKSGVKSVVAFATCMVAAVVITWAKGDLNFHDWVASAGVVYVLARTSYAGLWRPTKAAPAIEESTSVTKTPRR